MPKITQKGQVTIPIEIRNRFAMEPGTEVAFVVRDNSVMLVKPQKENKFRKWLGAGGVGSRKDVDEFVDRMRGRDDA